jgi:hypothetical protein
VKAAVKRPDTSRGARLIAHSAVGAPGFGAWRELAVHTMTTNWVLAAEHEGFPLMYHWRVLPDSTPLPEELADIERAVAYWGGGSQVRRRIHALQQSSASVTLFVEYIPQNLHQWLGTQVKAGDQTANRACAMVERELAAGISFMNSCGLLHFDAHFENILTDGQRLYFADYGLAALYGYQGEDHYALVRAYAEGARPTGIPAEAAAILARHAPPWAGEQGDGVGGDEVADGGPAGAGGGEPGRELVEQVGSSRPVTIGASRRRIPGRARTGPGRLAGAGQGVDGDASPRRQFVTTWLQVRRLRSRGRGGAQPLPRPCPRTARPRPAGRTGRRR